MDKIYLKKVILSYNDICNLLNNICNDEKYENRLKKEITTCYTTFNYPLNSYSLGKGRKHVLIISNTHGCEIVTPLFVLEFILTIILNDNLYSYLSQKYTFHFIPLLNPDGYIISSSQVYFNLKDLSCKEIEDISKTYLDAYNLDDKLAKENKKYEKLYKSVLRTSCNLIKNNNMIYSVNRILKNCNLDSKVLPIWSANGIGVDPNSNSIHRFCEMNILRNKWKYSRLRYNDIPVTCPSPMSYPGQKSLGKDSPENVFLYKYITNLYFNLPKQNEKLIAIFSYHSTGGEIYGYPDKCISSKENIQLHNKAMKIYSDITGYTPIDEDLKYGVMDFYRAYLNNTVSLTIELSKLNANPIGPFAKLDSLFEEFNNNKRAILSVIENIENKSKNLE